MPTTSIGSREVPFGDRLDQREQVIICRLAGVKCVGPSGGVAEPSVGHCPRQVGIAYNRCADVAAVACFPLLTAGRLAHAAQVLRGRERLLLIDRTSIHMREDMW